LSEADANAVAFWGWSRHHRRADLPRHRLLDRLHGIPGATPRSACSSADLDRGSRCGARRSWRAWRLIVALRRGTVPIGFGADAAAPGIALGFAIGRIGDIINGEHHATLCTAPLGICVEYTNPATSVRVRSPDR